MLNVRSSCVAIVLVLAISLFFLFSRVQNHPPEHSVLMGPYFPSATLLVGEKMNLNTVDLFSLEALPGIGPGRAERILEYREQHGKFQRVEDILNVTGIGPGIMESIRPFIFVEH
ncbi:MAG: hypothetical protein A3I05_04400 [Deltaproteobacteria bacterium RIFCSPLOWO2_02_FULL_44_10]|nr:MAG: hypothetical protein A3C46_07205 [Deltaproteobacteria bacterium RIFCSPHIGHO2_02_FULL_44_16]OGQ46598.1 MAG: hypothetical protein A3I05_04400 [Deltaproteobacteria bacterium RIFCSPLOWO2_02_FULL_44_10]